MKTKIFLLIALLMMTSITLTAAKHPCKEGMPDPGHPCKESMPGEPGPCCPNDAPDGPGLNPDFGARLKEHLQLTDEQLKKLEAVRLELQKAAERIKIRIEKKELEIKEVMIEDKIDFDKIKSILKEINDLELELKLNRWDHLQKVEKLISKEQFEKFKMFFFRAGGRDKMPGKDGKKVIIKKQIKDKKVKK
mgnify:CR=1 FL=1